MKKGLPEAVCAIKSIFRLVDFGSGQIATMTRDHIQTYWEETTTICQGRIKASFTACIIQAAKLSLQQNQMAASKGWGASMDAVKVGGPSNLAARSIG